MSFKNFFKRQAAPLPGPKPLTSIDMMKARYAELCAKRDEVNAAVASKLAEVERLNQVANEASAKAAALAQEVSNERGGQEWLVLKREIGMLARALSGK
jgi:hypothetical protein